MKKITLLFVTMLAMSFSSCGQKEPKLLWEREFGRVYGSTIQLGTIQANIRVSPSGNIMSITGNSWETFDKNGNTLWKSSDFGQISEQNLTDSEVNWVINKDTVYFFGGDYKLIAKLDSNYTNLYSGWIKKVNDGIVILRNDNIIKFDFNIKEVWRYKYSGLSRISEFYNQETIYHFLTVLDNGNRFDNLILSDDGKLLTQFKSSQRTIVTQSKDKGFWIYSYDYINPDRYDTINDINFIRYDSTGKQGILVSTKDINTGSNPIFNLPIFLPDGSFVISHHVKDIQKISFTKIDKSGNKKEVSKNISYSFIPNRSELDLKMINENDFMYMFKNNDSRSDSTLLSFGIANFDKPNIGWNKEILLYRRDIKIDKEGFLSYSQVSNEIIFYNLSGNEEWRYKNESSKGTFSATNPSFSDGIVYIKQQEELYDSITRIRNYYFSLTKIRLLDGKVIWKKPDAYKLFFDEEANEYPKSGKIDFIPKTSQWSSKFYDYPKNTYGYYPVDNAIDISFKKKELVVITLEYDGFDTNGNFYKSVVHKYSTQNSYDAIACTEKNAPQIEVVGNLPL
jgi:hypothetical protein